MKKIRDLPTSERPREKLMMRGAAALSDEELLAVILGRGAAGRDVLSLSRSLVKLIDEKGAALSVEDLQAVPGIGAAKATLVAAAFEFVRRRVKADGIKVRTAEDVFPLIRHFADRKQEHFLCISLNGAHEVLSVRVVTIGLVNSSQVHPREVFADVLAERAVAVILAHNHPSGDLEPSGEDRAVTERLIKAAEILGIKMLDHIIFSKRGYRSVM